MATLGSDNFNRADGGLGANWTTMSGRGAPQIISQVVGPDATDATALYTAATFPGDQWSQATLTTATSTGLVNVVVRGATGSVNLYHFEVQAPASNIIRAIGGSFAGIASGSAYAANDVFRLEAVGSLIAAYKNGILDTSVSDGNHTSGYAGIGANAGTTCRLDNWSGGDFTSGFVESRRIFIVRAG